MTTVKDCKEEKVDLCNHCCKTCSECPNCYDLNIEKIKKYLFAIDRKISDYSESYLCISEWGYGCRPVDKDSFEKLLIFRDYINTYYDGIRLGYNPEICPEEIQCVLEATSKLVDLNNCKVGSYTHIEINDDNFDLWVVNNPCCVAWEDWEYHLGRICTKIGFKVTDVTAACNIVYDLKTELIEESVPILYTLSVIQLAQEENCFDANFDISLLTCDIDYEIGVKLQQCKLDYNVLVSEHSCSLDFKTYVKLLKCNLSYKVISNLLNCGVDVTFNVEDQCPQIVVKNKTYNLSEFKVDVFTSEYFDKVFDSEVDKYYIQDLINSYQNSHLLGNGDYN